MEITKLGFDLVNIDATVIAERPKISPRLNEMKLALVWRGLLPVSGTST